jgi:YlbE-like protein
MRQDIYELIEIDADLLKFLRSQPMWYRKLMRNPHQLELFETEAAYFLEKSIPHRVSKLSDSVQFASMMLNMFQAMKT